MVLLIRLDTFYLLIILPSHIHSSSINLCTILRVSSQYTLSFIYYILPLYALLLFILYYQVFVLHRVSFICECTYDYVCNVSSPATEAE